MPFDSKKERAPGQRECYKNSNNNNKIALISFAARAFCCSSWNQVHQETIRHNTICVLASLISRSRLYLKSKDEHGHGNRMVCFHFAPLLSKHADGQCQKNTLGNLLECHLLFMTPPHRNDLLSM